MNKNSFGVVKDVLLVTLLVFISYLVFFNHLGNYTIRLWDEGRNAVNALEMVKNHNFLVTYYQGQPDMWNTKPPLFIWTVSLLFKIFGTTELSLRLPSALAGLIIVLTMYFFSRNYLKNRLTGLAAGLILLSAMGFSDWHIGRTGDFDALLTLLMFLQVISAFSYVRTGRIKHVYYLILWLTLAVLTKGVAGLFFLPAIITFLLFDNNLAVILKEKKVYLSIIVFVIMTGGYYLGREYINHGYLRAVISNELFGRYGAAVDTRNTDIWYYLIYLKEYRFAHFILLLPFSFVIYFITKNETIKRWTFLSFLVIVSYFLIISFSATKQLWYDAPLYPLMSMMVAAAIIRFIELTPPFLRLAPIIVFVFYTQRYIRTNIAYIDRPDLEKDSACIKYGYIFRNKMLENIKNNDAVFVQDDFCSPLDFYLERELNANWRRGTSDGVKLNDLVITCDTAVINKLNQKYKLEKTGVFEDYCFDFKVVK